MVQLAPGIRLAFVDERIILLDTLQDRYRMLHSEAARCLRSLANGDEPEDEAVAERLATLGILVPGDARIDPAVLPAPTQSALEMPQYPGTEPGLAAVAGAVLRTSWSLRTCGLAAMMERATLLVTRTEPGPFDLIGFAQGYARTRQLWPQRWICLRDSFAFHDLLLRSGGAATLVIGVRLDPFAAHCWVQAGDMVLNDRRDAVIAFKPILTL